MKDIVDMIVDYDRYLVFVQEISKKIPWYLVIAIFIIAALLLFGKISNTRLYFSLFVESGLPSEKESKKIVFNHLGGKIIFAKSFVNFKPKNEYIFALKEFSNKENGYGMQVVLLERMGNVYNDVSNKVIKDNFEGEGFFIEDFFGVVDISNDGNKFIYCVRTMRGNMAGSDLLLLSSTVAPYVKYAVTRSYDTNYQNEPSKFDYDFSDVPENEVENVKKAAMRIGFIENTAVTAGPVVEWAAENQNIFDINENNTRVKFIHYPIKDFTDNESSIEKIIKIGNFEFTSYFKGEVVATDIVKKIKFVVFAAPDRYDWVTDMHFENNRLWMMVRYNGIVFIDFDKLDYSEGKIQKVTIKGIDTSEGVEFTNNGLLVNGKEYSYASLIE